MIKEFPHFAAKFERIERTDLAQESKVHSRVGVVGLGSVGTLSVKLALRAGLEVVGYDRDKNRIEEFKSNTQHDPLLLVSHNSVCLTGTDIILVAIRLQVSESGSINLEPLRKVAEMLNSLPPIQRLVVLQSTVPPGITRQFANEWLQPSKKGQFLVAHCPERLKIGDTVEDLLLVPRLVGGMCQEATDITCKFLEQIGIQPVPVSAPEVSELSKLLENTFLTVGIGLMGEITRISHALSLNTNEVAKAASTKPNGYFPFYPGPGIGGHCLPNDLQILRKIASDVNIDAPILKGVNNSIKLMTPAVIIYLDMLLKEEGIHIKDARIWIIGIGFKVDSSDLTRSPAIDLVRELRQRDALPMYSDSRNLNFEVDNISVERILPETFPDDVMAVLILAGDRSIDLSTLNERIPIILDVGGSKIMPGDCPRMRSL